MLSMRNVQDLRVNLTAQVCERKQWTPEQTISGPRGRDEERAREREKKRTKR